MAPSVSDIFNKMPSRKLFRFVFRSQETNIGMVIALHRVISGNQVNKDSPNNFIEISEAKFESVITDLKMLGVRFISLQELDRLLGEKTKSSDPVVHLSFDDGYYDNYSIAYPLLKKYHIPFSIFVSSDFLEIKPPFLWWYILEAILKDKQDLIFEKYDYSYLSQDYGLLDLKLAFNDCRDFLLEHIDKDTEYFQDILFRAVSSINGFTLPRMLHWDDLALMLKDGLLEIGIHTRSHARFSKLEPALQEQELMECRQTIISHLGKPSNFFAYPYGSADDIGTFEENHQLLAKCGIRLAFTTMPGELNNLVDKSRVPRVFLNDSCNLYTLKSRLDGSYQRSLLQRSTT